ncbi:MAG: hypothetical protein BHV99_01375 [Clostridium sp. 26_21]|nr:MAG: hypothetical protein BHV99_01375 [Clostridium sp. 26_21]
MNLIMHYITSDFNFALMLLGLMLTGVGFWCMTDSRQFFLFHLLGGLALMGFGIPILILAI